MSVVLVQLLLCMRVAGVVCVRMVPARFSLKRRPQNFEFSMPQKELTLSLPDPVPGRLLLLSAIAGPLRGLSVGVDR